MPRDEVDPAAFIGLAHLRRTADELTPRGSRSSSYIDNITTWLIE